MEAKVGVVEVQATESETTSRRTESDELYVQR